MWNNRWNWQWNITKHVCCVICRHMASIRTWKHRVVKFSGSADQFSKAAAAADDDEPKWSGTKVAIPGATTSVGLKSCPLFSPPTVGNSRFWPVHRNDTRIIYDQLCCPWTMVTTLPLADISTTVRANDSKEAISYIFPNQEISYYTNSKLNDTAQFRSIYIQQTITHQQSYGRPTVTLIKAITYSLLQNYTRDGRFRYFNRKC